MLDILDQGRAARGLPPLHAKPPELGARAPVGIILPRPWSAARSLPSHAVEAGYIADAEMREVSCAIYISKRAAVVSIRAMLGAGAPGLPLFYTVK
jgi:hypothetical protein